MLLGDLRKYLNKVERPVPPWVLLGIRQSLEPSLVLVENENCGLFRKHVYHQLIAWDVGFLVASPFPFTKIEWAFGMLIKQCVPKKLVALEMKTFCDDDAIFAEIQVSDADS